MTRVAVIQMTSGESLDDNLYSASELIQEAASQGAEFVQLPENFPVISDDEYAKVRLGEAYGSGPIQEFLSYQSKTHGIWLIGGTIPLKSHETDHVYNSCLLYGPDGNVTERYDKAHLFDVSVGGKIKESYCESDTITPGKDIIIANTPIARIGMSVCYDLRFPELYRKMMAEDINLISVPSAFTFSTGKHHWQTLLKARAVENLCFVVAANQTGQNTPKRSTWGHSMILGPWGDILAVIEDGAGIAIADLDFQKQANLRKSFPALEHRKF